jgi:hypothetical protein
MWKAKKVLVGAEDRSQRAENRGQGPEDRKENFRALGVEAQS